MTLKDQRFYFFKEKSVYLFLKKLNLTHRANLGETGCRPQALPGPLPVPPAAQAGRSLTSTRLSRALKPAALAGPCGSRRVGVWAPGDSLLHGSCAWHGRGLPAAGPGGSRHPRTPVLPFNQVCDSPSPWPVGTSPAAFRLELCVHCNLVLRCSRRHLCLAILPVDQIS